MIDLNCARFQGRHAIRVAEIAGLNPVRSAGEIQKAMHIHLCMAFCCAWVYFSAESSFNALQLERTTNRWGTMILAAIRLGFSVWLNAWETASYPS